MTRCAWLIAGWWIAACASVFAATPKPAAEGLDGLIAELLDWSAPAPDWGEQVQKRMEAGWESPRLSWPKPPAEDAPIAVLAAYWSSDRWGHLGRPAEPGQAVVGRLLKHCEERPEVVKGFLDLFDEKNLDTVSRLRRLHDGLPVEPETLKEAKEALHQWLVLWAGEFRDELAKVARQSLDDPRDENKVHHLWKFHERDREGAEAMLRQAAKENAGAVRAVALLRLYEKRLEQRGPAEDAELKEWRRALQKVVESDEKPWLRAEVLKTLVKSKWEGRDEWILALFADTSLGEVEEGHEVSYPLARIAGSDPDFWIPRIVPLVNNANRIIHNNAVRCLVQFHLEDSRADALRPLLPWLSDPNWAQVEDDYARLRIIQSVDRLDLPECIPGLLWVVEHDEGACLEYVAEPLVHYRVTQAVPALKRALQKEGRFAAKAIVELGGLSTDEMVDAAVARLLRRAPMPSAFGDEGAASDQEVLGTAVLSIKNEDEDFAAALLRKAGELKGREPMASERIERWLAGTHTRAGVKSADAILREGRFSSTWLRAAVANRDYLGKRLSVVPKPAVPAGAIRAFLAGDEAEVAAVFERKDDQVKALLCALARLERLALPLQPVGRLMSAPNELHARAAEQYLLTDDSAEARPLIWAHHAGKAAIVGARTTYDPGHHTFGQFAGLEKRLRERVLEEGGPAEIHALLSSGYWGNNGQIIIESRPNQHLLIQEQGMGRRAVRELTAEEWEALQKLLAGQRVEELGPYDQGAHDGIQYEYVRVNRRGGVRVFMNNPPNAYDVLRELREGQTPDPKEPTGDVYGYLVEHLRSLTENKDRFQLTYAASAKVPGLRIVVRKEEAVIEAVASHAGGVAVLAKFAGQKRSAWRLLKDGQLAAEVAGEEPMVASGWKKDFEFQEHLVNARWQAGFGRAAVVPGSRKKDDKTGLWIFEEGVQPRLLAEGVFANPVTTPDGEWVVAAKQEGASWAAPNGVVRVRIANGEMIPLDLEPCDTFQPIAWVQPRERVLIYLARDPEVPGVQPDAGPGRPQYRLLDPATGESSIVTGEFGPLEQVLPRPLQPVKGDPNLVWAAMPVVEAGEAAATRICHYDVKNFTLKTLVELPEAYFETGAMWVDEVARVIYAVINGDLISFPMPE